MNPSCPITATRLFCHACREWYDLNAFHVDNRPKMAHRHFRRNHCRVCRQQMRAGDGEYERARVRNRELQFRRRAWQWFVFEGHGTVNGWEEVTDGVDASAVVMAAEAAERRARTPKKMPKNKRQRRANRQRGLFGGVNST